MTECTVPIGYASTMDCMNQPDSWDVPGMIADMAENLRRGNDVAPGQLLAALDWMAFRLKESRALLVVVDSDKARETCMDLKGFI